MSGLTGLYQKLVFNIFSILVIKYACKDLGLLTQAQLNLLPPFQWLIMTSRLTEVATECDGGDLLFPTFLCLLYQKVAF